LLKYIHSHLLGARVHEACLCFCQDLVELIVESNQELPSWLEAMALENRSSFGGGGPKRGGGKGGRFGGSGFGGKDYRFENGGRGGGGGGGGGGRGGGGGGGRSGYGGGGGGPGGGGANWSGPAALRSKFLLKAFRVVGYTGQNKPAPSVILKLMKAVHMKTTTFCA
jgi:hypothetical protein